MLFSENDWHLWPEPESCMEDTVDLPQIEMAVKMIESKEYIFVRDQLGLKVKEHGADVFGLI